MRAPTRWKTWLSAALLGAGCLTPALAASGGTIVNSGSGTDTEVAGEVLVKLRSTGALAPLLAKYPVTLVSRFGARPIYRLKAVGAARVRDLLVSLSAEPEVMIAENNPTQRSPEARKNMPWAIGTPGAYSAQWAPAAMHLDQAQRLSQGAGVRVAVLDTGVDRSHPALAGRLLPGFDFVDFDSDPSEVGSAADAGYGHGTHVAGLVALVAPQARILPLRVLDAGGVGNAWVLAEALLYALDPDGNPATDDGAQVISMSLGSMARTRILDTIADIAACIPAVPNDAIGDRSDPGYGDDDRRCAARGGAVVISAAGNDASDRVKQYPAAEGAHGLVSVAASNGRGRLASFSNFGGWIDLAAPGEGITSSLPGDGYGSWNGTSMAAPLVAGTAALLRSALPGVPARDLVRRILRTTATLCGTRLGQLDAQAALLDRTPEPLVCQ